VSRTVPVFLLICIVAVGSLQGNTAEEWPPIPKQELEMTDDPANPGAAAILLYREVNTYDVKGYETEYRRIKIFKDAGKKYADIEIPYFDNEAKIEDLKARTTSPDGTAVEFRGQIFDRTVVKARKIKVKVKAFTLPNVQRGSIIEYSYTSRFREKAPDVLKHPRDYIYTDTLVVPSASWIVQQELFTVRARFVVHTFPKVPFFWGLKVIPQAVHPHKQKDGSTVVEVQNIPSFQKEEFMPPENWVKSRILGFYVLGFGISRQYWSTQAARWAKVLKPFLGNPDKLKPEIAGIISDSDPPEVKLRKLYSRVQKIRNLSYEPSKTEQELNREKIKDNKNVKDVLKHDYAYANEINLVLVALARAADFESAPVRVASRSSTFFDPNYPNPNQLDSMIVWVRAGGKDYFLDPATRYCPFDLLPWEESDSRGIVLVEEAFPFIQSADENYEAVLDTPQPTSDSAVVERVAALEMSTDGGVEGSVAVSFVGQEALERRIAMRNLDEAARKKMLEDEIKGWLTPATTAQIDGSVNWEQSDQPLRATFHLKLPEFAIAAGRKLLFRAGFFEGSVKSFKTGTRIYDIHFPHPFQEKDEITWIIPMGFRMGNLPEKRNVRTIFGDYSLSVEHKDGRIYSIRSFTSESTYVRVADYPALRDYFDQARQGDESHFILEMVKTNDSKE
jgi:hypothetical protein